MTLQGGGIAAAVLILVHAASAAADAPPPAIPPSPEPSSATTPSETTQPAPARPPTTQPAATESEPQAEAPPSRAWETAPATRRSGFIAGLTIGLSLGHIAGYPNDQAKLNNPAYRASVSGIGSDLSLYIGGALADYFNFELGITSGSNGNSSLTGATSGFIFRIEAFPFFGTEGSFKDLAFLADFGPGSGLIFRGKDRHDEAASAPTLSIVHAGLQWELQRWAGGHIANGPILLGEYEWADGMERYAIVAGFRMAFYGGP